MDDRSRKEILFVDNDKNMLNMLEMRFVGEGYFVHKLSDPIKVIEYITHNPTILLAVIDLRMPKMDGIDLLREIKQKAPHITVIIFTAHGSINSVIEAMKAGAYDYITKPFDFTQVKLLIEKVFQKIYTENLLANLTGRVFLSYAREDRFTVEELYDKLSKAGYHPWMDIKDITAGERWEKKITEIIESSSFFIACLSSNSVNKRGMVQKEVKKGLSTWENYTERDIYIIPARLEECPVPKQLREFQWVDLFKDDGWENLVKSIRRGLEIRSHLAY